MIYDIWSDLTQVYISNSFQISEKYRSTVQPHLKNTLSYNSQAMHGMTATLFTSPRLIAHNLVQNSIDEAKGAARVELIAQRYAPSPE